MNSDRFLPDDIDPSWDGNVISMKEDALEVIHQELADDKQLHDEAVVAILNDYEEMPAKTLLKQLRTYSLILAALEDAAAFQKMLMLLSSLLRIGIHRVDSRALAAVTVQRDAIKMEVDGNTTFIGSVHAEFLTILSFAKESHEIERRLATIERLVGYRNDDNLKAVSSSFKMSSQETGSLLQIIEKLFDDRGNFVRQAFEPMTDQLAAYGEQTFELLWCTFKALKGRANRVAFLNALQHLIGKINRPKHALRFLLADFYRHPDHVAPSDRNAVMLANILLRTYNKELDVDIEMTPEEVLSIRNGLDLDVVHYAQFRIESVAWRFSAKVRTIHQMIRDRLDTPSSSQEMPSVRHLLFLEREILIFLSLLAGNTAHQILLSALTEYGDPKKGIYRDLQAAAYLPVFLQHLKIIVRGIGRVGTLDDVERLKEISAHGLALSEMSGTPKNQRSVIRTMEWIDNVIRGITTAIGDPA